MSGWLNRYRHRIQAVHCKDGRAGRMVELGTGELPWKEILPRLSTPPMRYWILEQDEFPTGDPWGEIARGLALLESCQTPLEEH